jgi:hypothetical protein
MNKKWECFLCGEEDYFQILPTGYLSNSHPLCSNCANIILYNENHNQRFRLTYHKDIGDISFVADIPVPVGNFIRN